MEVTSPLLNTLPSIDQILRAVPPGGDPFSFGLSILDSSVFPPVPPATFHILIFFSILHGCTIFASSMIIFLPFFRRREAQKKFWLVKKIHMDGSSNVYWIPNSSVAVAVFQLVTSSLSEIYAYVLYASLKSPVLAGKMSIGICIQFMWLFNFYSYFVTSWGAASTRLCCPRSLAAMAQLFTKQPRGFYVLCASVPIAVTLATSCWVVALGVAYRKQNYHLKSTRNMLLSSSARWKSGKILSSREFIDSVEAGKALIESSAVLITRLRWNSFAWAIIWTITLLIYTLSVWPLVKIIRIYSEKMVQARVTQENCMPPKLQSPAVGTCAPPDRDKKAGAALHKGYLYFVAHCTIMTIFIIYIVAVCIVLGIHTDKVILMSQWRSLGSWLYLVSGAFSAVAMLSQSWRSYQELPQSSRLEVELATHPEADGAGETTSPIPQSKLWQSGSFSPGAARLLSRDLGEVLVVRAPQPKEQYEPWKPDTPKW